MKRLILFTFLVFSLPVFSYTQAFSQNTDFAAGVNKLQNYPDPFEEFTSVKFELAKDCYVKLFVVDPETGIQTVLIDGEMGSGKQGVIFRSNKNHEANKVNYRCVLEVYSLNRNSLLYTSEIKMTQK